MTNSRSVADTRLRTPETLCTLEEGHNLELARVAGRRSRNADFVRRIGGVIWGVRLQDLGIDQLLESVRDAVVVADARTGRIVLWNSAATKIFGYSSSEALEHSWTVIVPERLKAQCEAGMARYRDTGHGPYIDSHVAVELPAVRKDSEEITVEISLSPINPSHNAEDRGHLVLAIIRDVTERKQAETRAKDAESRYRALVENVPAIVYIEDVETQATLYDSPQIEAMLGYPANTCEKDPHYWEKIVHPEDRERIMAAEVAATERGEFKLEYRVLASDGRLCGCATTLPSYGMRKAIRGFGRALSSTLPNASGLKKK
jgi:PAS domain S-box-containing protein